MAQIPVALREPLKLVYLSLRGVMPADDANDLSAVDLDAPPVTMKQLVVEKFKEILKRRDAWLAYTPQQRDRWAQEIRGIKYPRKQMKKIRFVGGQKLEGVYHGNFAGYVFVNCDVSKARFMNCNMSRAIFYNCTQIDAVDPNVFVRFYKAGEGCCNMANCVGLDDEIYEGLVTQARKRFAYQPVADRSTRVGWIHNPSRCTGLGFEADEAEPKPTVTALVALGTVKDLKVKKVGARIKRILHDYTAEEE